ncbi:MAG: protein kinase domain-containing protein [Gemmataceae bacterium]
MSPEGSPKRSPRGQRFGKYEILAHIATGGMGAVYKARDTELGRDVALKILPPNMAAKPIMLERFKREAINAARLRHENIVTLYDWGKVKDTYFLALEFVEGIDLGEYINRKGRLDPEEARLIGIQAAHALNHAFQNGLVHRDIKPSNFLIARPNGSLVVKLTDMGLSRATDDEDFRVTRAGTTVGTVDYMSPEQARDSGAADIRSDLYSLGCTLFHMLTGQPPFPEGSLTERLYKHCESDPPNLLEINPHVSPSLCVILERLLAKRPEDRYATPEDLIEDLVHLETIPAATIPAGVRPMELLAGLAEGKAERPRKKERRSSDALRAVSKPGSDSGELVRKKTKARSAPTTQVIIDRRELWQWILIGSLSLIFILGFGLLFVLWRRHRKAMQDEQTSD